MSDWRPFEQRLENVVAASVHQPPERVLVIEGDFVHDHLDAKQCSGCRAFAELARVNEAAS